MATYLNNLRLKEITTGDEDGTWGTSTNTNLSIITDGFGYGTLEVAADADETFTMPDGTASDTRAMYLEFTSAVSLTATRTITLGPNTVSKLWIIENSTSGSQSISIKQGSGSEVEIVNGATTIVYTDGAGTTGAVTNASENILRESYIDQGNITGATNVSFNSDVVEVTMTGNATLTFTDIPASGPADLTLIVNQDVTGGHSITWPAAAVYAGGVAPPQTTTTAAQDVWTIFTVDGGTTLYVSLAIKDVS